MRSLGYNKLYVCNILTLICIKPAYLTTLEQRDVAWGNFVGSFWKDQKYDFKI